MQEIQCKQCVILMQVVQDTQAVCNMSCEWLHRANDHVTKMSSRRLPRCARLARGRGHVCVYVYIMCTYMYVCSWASYGLQYISHCLHWNPLAWLIPLAWPLYRLNPIIDTTWIEYLTPLSSLTPRALRITHCLHVTYTACITNCNTFCTAWIWKPLHDSHTASIEY